MFRLSKIKFFISLFISLLVLFPAFSVSDGMEEVDTQYFDDFVHKNWTTSDGLPGMTITTLIQDL